MIKSLQNSAAGINSQQSRIDATASNVAGVNTDTFKRQRVSFSDLVYEKLAGSGLPVKPGADPAQGSGSRQVAVLRNFDQGVLRETGRETDLAVSGRGFFKLTLPDGRTAYTRYGGFKVSAQGELVSEEGYSLYPGVVLPQGFQEVMVDRNGKISARGADGEVSELADLTLSNFINPAALEPLGGGLFAATDQAGPEEEVVPGQNGLGEIIQKNLESSNVDLAAEMTELLESQKAYQVNARALRTSDEIWSMANNLRK